MTLTGTLHPTVFPIKTPIQMQYQYSQALNPDIDRQERLQCLKVQKMMSQSLKSKPFSIIYMRSSCFLLKFYGF